VETLGIVEYLTGQDKHVPRWKDTSEQLKREYMPQ